MTSSDGSYFFGPEWPTKIMKLHNRIVVQRTGGETPYRVEYHPVDDPGGKMVDADIVSLNGVRLDLLGHDGFALSGGFNGETAFDAEVETSEVNGRTNVYIALAG